MMNGEFDIYYDSCDGKCDQPAVGNRYFHLPAHRFRQSPESRWCQCADAGHQQPELDDTFATTSFIIGNPTAFIDPIGDHAVGDKFTITGSTNLAVGNKLISKSPHHRSNHTQKSQSAEFSGSAGTVTSRAGNGGFNRWSFDVDASTFKPDEYLVKVSGRSLR